MMAGVAPTASGGRIVDNDWGADVGDYLRYEVATPQPCETLFVTIRFARGAASPASIRVSVGEQSEKVQFPYTGGWGFQDSQWRHAEVRLKGVSAGKHVVHGSRCGTTLVDLVHARTGRVGWRPTSTTG